MSNNYKNKIISVLKEIQKDYPNISFAQHLANITAEYKDISDITDKEFLHLSTKYQCIKELDIAIPHIDNLDSILEQEGYLDEEDEEEDF